MSTIIILTPPPPPPPGDIEKALKDPGKPVMGWNVKTVNGKLKFGQVMTLCYVLLRKWLFG